MIQKHEGTFLNKLSISVWIVISLITILIDTLHRDSLIKIRSFVLDLSSPVVKVAEVPVLWFNFLNDSITEFRDIVDNNEKLKTEILELQHYKNSYYVLKQENSTFRSLLKYNRSLEKSFITSRVIGNTGGIYHRTLLLDKGMKDGVKKNDGVMGIGGLLGKIVDVSENNSRVLLLTDMNSALPVFIIGSDERSIMQGDGGENPTLKFIENIETVKVGQKVITSGDGGMLPNGIPVGRVIAVDGYRAKVKLFTKTKNNLFARIVKFRYVKN